MSNAAYVIPKLMPSYEDLDKTVREVITTRFPNFGVWEADDKGWLIVHQSESDLAFNIWLEVFNRHEALQIPHKHRYGFMWWVEYEIRERLAKTLKARQFDEGVGKVKNHDVFYPTYSDYLRDVYGDFCDSYVEIAKMELPGLPPDVLAMMGDLIVTDNGGDLVSTG